MVVFFPAGSKQVMCSFEEDCPRSPGLWAPFTFTLSALTYGWLSRVCLFALVVRLSFIALRAVSNILSLERDLRHKHTWWMIPKHAEEFQPRMNHFWSMLPWNILGESPFFSDLGVKPLQSYHELLGPLTGHKVVRLLPGFDDFCGSIDLGWAVLSGAINIWFLGTCKRWNSMKSGLFFIFVLVFLLEVRFSSSQGSFSLEILADSWVGKKWGLEYLKASNEFSYFNTFPA